MNILQLVPRIPYPLTNGGNTDIFNITKYLALRGHQITMVAFDNNEENDLIELNTYCRLVFVPRSSRIPAIQGIINLLSDKPYNISRYYSKEYEKTLLDILKKNSFDVVHVDMLHMAYYGVLCKQVASLPIVLREQNIESVIMERFAQSTNNYLMRKYLSIQAKRINYYEASITSLFDMCCMITNEDQKRLKVMNPKVKSCLIMPGVENTYFDAPHRTRKKPKSICFLGTLKSIQNKDSLLWFLKEIFPLILVQEPETRLYIIGQDVPPKILSFQNDRIIFCGFVADLKEEIQKYQLLIVPLRIGGGVRFKIFESLALRVPVVTTSIGCEGIEVQHGKHVLIADSPANFAHQVLCMMRDNTLCDILTNNAYELASKSFRWERVAEQFERVYHEVAGH